MESQHPNSHRFEYGTEWPAPLSQFGYNLSLASPSDQLYYDIFSQDDTTLHPAQAPFPPTYSGANLLAEESPYPLSPAHIADEIFSQQGLDGAAPFQEAPIPLADGNFPLPELPSHSNADEGAAARPTNAHRSNVISYSAAIWEAHRPEIKTLYMDDLNSLKETMKNMAERHNFHPS
jgi:hypothetical protein